MQLKTLALTVAAWSSVFGGQIVTTYATEPPRPNCSYSYGMCAYTDTAGKAVTAPIYERAEPFHDGLAVVGIEGKFGYIAENGEAVIPLKFDSAGPFNYGLAPVGSDGKIGIIDRQGTQILPPIYATATPISRDAIIVSDKQRDGLYGIMTVTGVWLRKPDLIAVSTFFGDNGLGFIWAATEPGSYGLMNLQGAWVIEPKFKFVQGFQEGRAVVVENVGGKQKWGFVGEKGQIILEPTYDWLSYVYNGYALYRADGKEGLVDRNGKIVIEAKFDELERPGENGFSRAKLNGLEVFADLSGAVFNQLPTSRLPHCPDGRPLIVEQGKYFTLASKKYLTHKSAEYACAAPTAEQLSPHRFAFKSPDGKVVFEGDFDEVGISADGVALVKVGSKWGVVDWNGQYLIPLNESKCRLGYSGLGSISLQLKDKYINLDRDSAAALGRDMAPLAKCTGGSMTCSGVCPGKIGEKWGFVDDQGGVVLPPIYDYADQFRNGHAWVAIPGRRLWCSIDSSGAIDSEKGCGCGQPLIAFEHNYPHQKVGITDCYDAGVYDVVHSGMF